jgi:hypothetical protein
MEVTIKNVDTGKVYEICPTNDLIIQIRQNAKRIENADGNETIVVYEEMIFELLKKQYDLSDSDIDKIKSGMIKKYKLPLYNKTILAMFVALTQNLDGDEEVLEEDDFLYKFNKTQKGKEMNLLIKKAEAEEKAKENS